MANPLPNPDECCGDTVRKTLHAEVQSVSGYPIVEGNSCELEWNETNQFWTGSFSDRVSWFGPLVCDGNMLNDFHLRLDSSCPEVSGDQTSQGGSTCSRMNLRFHFPVSGPPFFCCGSGASSGGFDIVVTE